MCDVIHLLRHKDATPKLFTNLLSFHPFNCVCRQRNECESP